LNALVMDFALPASLFVATATTSRALLLAQWPLLLVFIVSMLALYALSYWMQRRVFGLDSSEASVQAINIALPNYAAAGLPLIIAVFGASDTIYVALSIATGSIVLSPLTLAILEANKAPADGQGYRAGGASAVRSAMRLLRRLVRLALWPRVPCGRIDPDRQLAGQRGDPGSCLGPNGGMVMRGLMVILCSRPQQSEEQRSRPYPNRISFFGVVIGKSVPNAVTQVTSASLIDTYLAGVFTMAGWMVLLNQPHPGAV
jgi:hypothetical protein